MKRNCFYCNRKTECYTPAGLAELKPDNESDCGALYTNYEEAHAFILAISNTIHEMGDDIENSFVEKLANHYNCDFHTVWTALE